MRTKTIGPRVGRKVWSICSNNHLGVGGLLLEISSREEESSSLPILERSTADLGEVKYYKKDSGAIEKKIEDGVRLMGRGAEHIKLAIHLEVTGWRQCFEVTNQTMSPRAIFGFKQWRWGDYMACFFEADHKPAMV
ncbi:hypothetical protein CASFOL_039855 [Castilleja foliolosa]|uniref:Uncharacterized protein n=1 Tax=Castilleja foliolosa TaxID=1961234 RepID=A0ABD3BI65_9LAMI